MNAPVTNSQPRPYTGPRVAPSAEFFSEIEGHSGPVYGWRFETVDDVEHNFAVDTAGGPTTTRHYRTVASELVVWAGDSELRFATKPDGSLVDGVCVRTRLLYAPTPSVSEGPPASDDEHYRELWGEDGPGPHNPAWPHLCSDCPHNRTGSNRCQCI